MRPPEHSTSTTSVAFSEVASALDDGPRSAKSAPIRHCWRSRSEQCPIRDSVTGIVNMEPMTEGQMWYSEQPRRSQMVLRASPMPTPRPSCGPSPLSQMTPSQTPRQSFVQTSSDASLHNKGVNALRRLRTMELVKMYELGEADDEECDHDEFQDTGRDSRARSARGGHSHLTASLYDVYAPPVLLRALGILPWYPETDADMAFDGGSIRDSTVSGVLLRRRLRCIAASRSAWYQRGALLVTTLALVGSVEQLVVTRGSATRAAWAGSMCYGADCLRLGLYSDVALAVGAVLGLASLTCMRRMMIECILILFMYAQREGFEQGWRRRTRWDLFATALVWLAAMSQRINSSGALDTTLAGQLSWMSFLQILAFAVTSSILMGLTFCVLYVCRALTTMVDRYCVNIACRPDLTEAVREWNVLQAVLRKSSAAIEHCFFVLQTTAFSTVLLGVADALSTNASNVDLLIPAAVLTLGIARIFYSAASVTEKCAHVPSLINAFGSDLDLDRQYIVQYIIQSAAGFHVFEVRLTSAMALNVAYLCGAAAFSVATKFVSQL